MTLKDIASARLYHQQITAPRFQTLRALMEHMTAIQAQDPIMAQWALGVRMPSLTQAKVAAAISEGKIIRTHILRPTWHFVAPGDIYWMLQLTAPHIKAAMRSRDKELELTETVYAKSNKILAKILRDHQHCDRRYIADALQQAGMVTNENRLSHLLMRAELDGLVCSGRMEANRHTYALLEERVPEKKLFSREEALYELATRFFTSHGPATLQDFIWWSGLPAKDARSGLEAARQKLISGEAAETTYWFKTPDGALPAHDNEVYLLPAFDEFIISYKDRAAALAAEHNSKAISNNGIFRPVVVVGGQVAGLWKRTMAGGKMQLSVQPFRGRKIPGKALDKAVKALGSFTGSDITVAIEPATVP